VGDRAIQITFLVKGLITNIFSFMVYNNCTVNRNVLKIIKGNVVVLSGINKLEHSFGRCVKS